MGDLTAEAVVEAGRRARARIEQKQAGVLCGLDVAQAVFTRLDPEVEWRPAAEEGRWREDSELPATIAELHGNARALLSGERTALNFLGHLSGVATLTATCVRQLEGSGVRCSTRARPSRACACWRSRPLPPAGGRNHRMGLYDAMLIKENHIALAAAWARRPGGRSEAAAPAARWSGMPDGGGRGGSPGAGADWLLLDNMDLDELRRSRCGGRPREARGVGWNATGITKEVAGTGVQFISLGGADSFGARTRPLYDAGGLETTRGDV